MKIIRKLFVCFLVLISIISIFPTIPVKAANLVVTLDPGHGGSDPGATGASAFGGMTEAEYNWIFCQYTKERLEQYGITVYLTRTQNQTLESLSARAHTAASYGSDAFVSIHCNSASASAEGSEVLVPNNNYRPAIGAASQSAATQVLNSLVAATGNKNRGLLLKNSQSGSTYPDGSIRDYYGIIANGKLQNIPVVMLVETGFVSNQGDYNRTFATDAVRKKVAYSIADGLAAYYGFSLAPQGPKVLRTVIDGLNYIDADGNTVGQAFTPGAYDSWTDKRITIDTGKITTLFDWGWIAFNADTYQFGYIINGKQRYRNAFTVEPEAAVTQQAASLGASKASRFECRLDTSWLSEGTNTVQVVVRLNGEENIFVLSEYTVYTTGVVGLNIDELKYLDESGNQIGQAFSPGAYGSWSDKTISINTDNVKTLVDRGWVVF
ncbi:MAG: N-acetylmuramoyl-L-alanine amidase, partial [Clostridia bacterium]|nr:N-acetylmuramoyl-L-alanine amidase [Clostridia bacterium]